MKVGRLPPLFEPLVGFGLLRGSLFSLPEAPAQQVPFTPPVSSEDCDDQNRLFDLDDGFEHLMSKYSMQDLGDLTVELPVESSPDAESDLVATGGGGRGGARAGAFVGARTTPSPGPISAQQLEGGLQKLTEVRVGLGSLVCPDFEPFRFENVQTIVLNFTSQPIRAALPPCLSAPPPPPLQQHLIPSNNRTIRLHLTHAPDDLTHAPDDLTHAPDDLTHAPDASSPTALRPPTPLHRTMHSGPCHLPASMGQQRGRVGASPDPLYCMAQ
jgi:hypothetical protein